METVNTHRYQIIIVVSIFLFFCLGELHAQAPDIVWAKSMYDQKYGLEISTSVVDNEGYVYATGKFKDTVDFNPDSGVYNLVSSSKYWNDVFIFKLNPDGKFVWAKSIGSAYDEERSYVLLLNAGYLYVCGTFGSQVDFDPGSGVFNLHTKRSNSFILKLTTSGNFVWAKAIASKDEGNNAIKSAYIHKNNLYLSGEFSDTTDFDPAPLTEYPVVSKGRYDMFLLKLDTAGNFKWIKNFGGKAYDAAIDLCGDTLGNIYVTGTYCDSLNFIDAAGNRVVLEGNKYSNIFIAKYNAAGGIVWIKSIGDLRWDEYVTSMQVDKKGDIYLLGKYHCALEMNAGGEVLAVNSQSIDQYDYDNFVLKLDTQGNALWINNINTFSYRYGQSLVLAGDYMYVLGACMSFLDIKTAKDTVSISYEDENLYLAKFDIHGNFISIKNMEGAWWNPYGMSMNQSGQAVIWSLFNKSFLVHTTQGDISVAAATANRKALVMFKLNTF